MHQPIQTVLLDRDGVINFDSPDYILTPERWIAIPGSLAAIAKLHQAGLAVAIVSNQSARGRGMIDAETFAAIDQKMRRAIDKAGGVLSAVCYCPHTPDEHCNCRKPLPGLVIDALAQCQARPEQTIMIGDSLRDVQAAIAAGVRPVLVQSGYSDVTAIADQAKQLVSDIAIYDCLSDAVDALLR